MSNAVVSAIPAAPPADALAELDVAARVLDELTARAVSLRIDMDEHARAPRIELDDGTAMRRLTPTQLLELLAG
jgi:hypothetical protein